LIGRGLKHQLTIVDLYSCCESMNTILVASELTSQIDRLDESQRKALLKVLSGMEKADFQQYVSKVNILGHYYPVEKLLLNSNNEGKSHAMDLYVIQANELNVFFTVLNNLKESPTVSVVEVASDRTVWETLSNLKKRSSDWH
jgi:hypothetical protein